MWNNNEIWFPLNVENIKEGLYEISTFGRVRNTKTKNLLQLKLLNNDNRYDYRYIYVNLSTYQGQKNFLVHRLMAQRFYPFQREGQNQVNHINNNRHDNNINNLEWCTPKYNTNHSIQYGNFKLAGDRSDSFFTNEQAEYICQQLEKGVSYNSILDDLNIEKTDNRRDLIGNIKRGLTYKSISQKYNFSNVLYNHSNYSNNDINEICKMISNNLDYKQIANNLNIDISNKKLKKYFYEFIRKIKNRETFKDISENYIW